MALTCEIMIDLEFVSYDVNGKLFPSYKEAWYYAKSIGIRKVKYYYTITGQSFNRVCEIENAHRRYCQKVTGCDYYDFKFKLGFKQLNLIGEL